MQRLQNFDESKLISIDEIDRKYGIVSDDVESADEVEFE